MKKGLKRTTLAKLVDEEKNYESFFIMINPDECLLPELKEKHVFYPYDFSRLEVLYTDIYKGNIKGLFKEAERLGIKEPTLGSTAYFDPRPGIYSLAA